jgi:predicted  nucleic acid-binding Zn-ribbon protein
MKELATRVMKKVSLEIIYEAIEERTREIKEEIGELKQKQENDFRYLNQKIDTQIGQVRQEIGQVRQEIGQVNQKIDSQIGQVRQEIGQLNQRFDTVMQMLVEINKQIAKK